MTLTRQDFQRRSANRADRTSIKTNSIKAMFVQDQGLSDIYLLTTTVAAAMFAHINTESIPLVWWCMSGIGDHGFLM